MKKVNKKAIVFLILGIIISTMIIFTTTTYDFKHPQMVYRVYLKGKSMGLLKSKKELESYIDKEQEYLKEKYKIEKVYAPKDLDIEKEITYKKNISTTKEIYEKIKDKEPFTITGYEITIEESDEGSKEKKKEKKTQTLYVLNKNVFKEAVEKYAKAFLTEETFNAYKNNTQKEVTNTGKLLENVYIDNDIKITKMNIASDNTIYTNVEDLSKYLLFGTLKAQNKYTVKEGDTIEDISFNNKLSVEEFMIANPEFNAKDNMLYPGQVVTLGILKPQLSLVTEEHVVEIQEVKYKTDIEYDENLMIGTNNVKQTGSNGSNRVTEKVKKVNGETTNVVITNTEEIKAATNEIIVRGGASGSVYGDTYWTWPTKTPYSISSSFGYRWGALHDGIDIIGPGAGSPIYAANNGVVATASSKFDNGNYIVINHNNGIYTMYAHLSAFYVQEGQVVKAGQLIGGMGATGWATGTHLHFGVFSGGFPYYGGTAINPLSLYS